MINIYPIIISSMAGMATVLGNIMLFVPIKYKDKILSLAFGLSFAVLMLISLGELVVEGLKFVEGWNYVQMFVCSLLLLLCGCKLVDKFDHAIGEKNELYRVGVLSMISLVVHNIPEGIICAMTSSIDIKLGLKMSLAILIHNIPEGICICLPIYYATMSKRKALWMTVFSGSGEVIGAILTILFLRPLITPIVLYVIFMVTAGIMISLSLKKLLVQGIKLQQFRWFFVGIILGLVIVMITL